MSTPTIVDLLPADNRRFRILPSTDTGVQQTHSSRRVSSSNISCRRSLDETPAARRSFRMEPRSLPDMGECRAKRATRSSRR